MNMIKELKNDPFDDLIQIFSSRGKSKIVILLAKEMELNISKIMKLVQLNYKSTFKYCTELEEENVLQEKRYGRIRLYKFRNEIYRNKLIKNLIDLWN